MPDRTCVYQILKNPKNEKGEEVMKKPYTTPMMASVRLSEQDILTDSLMLSLGDAQDQAAVWKIK